MINYDIYRRSIEFFIGVNPIEIEISRPEKVSTSGGGWKFDRSSPTIISGQTVRLVSQTDNRTRTNTEGRVNNGNPYIVGLSDLDIEEGDQFTIEDILYEVRWISRDPFWRLTAEVVRRG